MEGYEGVRPRVGFEPEAVPPPGEPPGGSSYTVLSLSLSLCDCHATSRVSVYFKHSQVLPPTKAKGEAASRASYLRGVCYAIDRSRVARFQRPGGGGA